MSINLKLLGVLVLLVQAFAAVLAPSATAQSPSDFRLVTSAFPPYSFEGDNRAEGLTVDTVRDVFKELGLAPVIEVYPWARAYKTAREEPGTLLFSVARTREREMLFTWIGPVMEFDVWLFRKASRSDIRVEEFSDLADYTFAGLIKDVKTSYLEGLGAFVTEVRSEDLAIKMLAAGRIDMIASDQSAMMFRLEKLGYDKRDFVPVRKLDALSRPLYLVAHPGTDPRLVERLRQVLAGRARGGD